MRCIRSKKVPFLRCSIALSTSKICSSSGQIGCGEESSRSGDEDAKTIHAIVHHDAHVSRIAAEEDHHGTVLVESRVKPSVTPKDEPTSKNPWKTTEAPPPVSLKATISAEREMSVPKAAFPRFTYAIASTSEERGSRSFPHNTSLVQHPVLLVPLPWFNRRHLKMKWVKRGRHWLHHLPPHPPSTTQ